MTKNLGKLLYWAYYFGDDLGFPGYKPGPSSDKSKSKEGKGIGFSPKKGREGFPKYRRLFVSHAKEMQSGIKNIFDNCWEYLGGK